jgi:hypothetical protein
LNLWFSSNKLSRRRPAETERSIAKQHAHPGIASPRPLTTYLNGLLSALSRFRHCSTMLEVHCAYTNQQHQQFHRISTYCNTVSIGIWFKHARAHYQNAFKSTAEPSTARNCQGQAKHCRSQRPALSIPTPSTVNPNAQHCRSQRPALSIPTLSTVDRPATIPPKTPKARPLTCPTLPCAYACVVGSVASTESLMIVCTSSTTNDDCSGGGGKRGQTNQPTTIHHHHTINAIIAYHMASNRSYHQKKCTHLFEQRVAHKKKTKKNNKQKTGPGRYPNRVRVVSECR